jgi:hypothetical protein
VASKADVGHVDNARCSSGGTAVASARQLNALQGVSRTEAAPVVQRDNVRRESQARDVAALVDVCRASDDYARW